MDDERAVVPLVVVVVCGQRRSEVNSVLRSDGKGGAIGEGVIESLDSSVSIRVVAVPVYSAIGGLIVSGTKVGAVWLFIRRSPVSQQRGGTSRSSAWCWVLSRSSSRSGF
jgi:hypothetical protein